MHHFTDGGLDNIWLANGYTEHKTSYGKGVSIHDLDGLVRALCLNLVQKPHKLNGKEFRYLRQALLLSQGSVAALFGCTEQTVSLWERHGRVPLWADKLLRMTYIGNVQENTTVKELIDRMNFVDRVVNQKVVLHETAEGWESSLSVPEAIAA
jgi:DNA-binding transcriptional regulator YiaG